METKPCDKDQISSVHHVKRRNFCGDQIKFVTLMPSAVRYMTIVRDLKPREVMVYTLDREAPAEGLEKFTAEEMEILVRPLIEEGMNIQIRG